MRTKKEYLRNIHSGKKCVLCGGYRDADTAEHAPPSVMFPNKARPRGLEVPACERCNRDSSQIDQFAAFTAMSADPEYLVKKKTLTAYDQKVISGVANNFEKITGSKNALPIADSKPIFILDDEGRPLGHARALLFGKTTSEQLAKWAAKQVLALWYVHSGKIASHRSTINIHIMTNASQPSNDLKAMIAEMGNEYTLRDAHMDKTNEFTYRIAVDIIRNIGIVFAQYHGGFAFIGCLKDNPSAKLSNRTLDFRFSTNGHKGIYKF